MLFLRSVIVRRGRLPEPAEVAVEAVTTASSG
jgi:hypothetical protein